MEFPDSFRIDHMRVRWAHVIGTPQPAGRLGMSQQEHIDIGLESGSVMLAKGVLPVPQRRTRCLKKKRLRTVVCWLTRKHE
jgi:hypothetical protein